MPENTESTKKDRDLVTKVLWMLESERFARWYGPDGKFDRYITGDMAHEEKLTNVEAVKIIRADIARFLGVADE